MKFTWSSIKSQEKRHSLSSLKRLLGFTIPHINKIILAAICVLLVNSAQLLKPYILKLVIDDFLIGGREQRGFYTITTMGWLYFLVVLLGGIFSIAQVNLINRAAQEIMKTLRGRVFKTIQHLPLSYLDKTSSGRLITRATNDVEALSEMYTDVIISLFKDIFLLIGIVYTMLTLNLGLALVSFTVVPFMFFIVFLLKGKIRNNFKRMKSLIGRINGFMAENISGMKVVQIFNGEREKMQEFLNLNGEYFKSTLFQVRINSILRPAADIFQNLAIALIIWYGMGRIGNGSLEIGVLYAFTTYIKQFFAPISDLADNYTTIESALVSADRIFELLDKEEILEDINKGKRVKDIKGEVEFKNVWFSYGEDWVLRDISFKLKRGETAALIGETGAGKTTIINLISGFYKLDRGEILIDGINIKDIRLKDLRRNIGVVLQDVFLFAGDVKTNITLRDEIDDEKISYALEASNLKEFMENTEDRVTERGSTLSAGERQLISFARVIAHDTPILILDEATSNIDTSTELLIQSAFENASRNKTTIVIAHRLSTIRNADKIIVLRHGQIIEMGSHEELVEINGYYKGMLDESQGIKDEKKLQLA